MGDSGQEKLNSNTYNALKKSPIFKEDTMMKTQLVIKVFLTAALLLLSCLSGFVQAKVIFVDANRPAGGDGSTWEKAYPYLQYALAAAVSGDYIVVAPGTYKPDQGIGITPGDRSASFKLKGGVDILGGYAGYNAPNPDEHNVLKTRPSSAVI